MMAQQSEDAPPSFCFSFSIFVKSSVVGLCNLCAAWFASRGSESNDIEMKDVVAMPAPLTPSTGCSSNPMTPRSSLSLSVDGRFSFSFVAALDGDDLKKIAIKSGTTISRILELNPKLRSRSLAVGTVVKVPVWSPAGLSIRIPKQLASRRSPSSFLSTDQLSDLTRSLPIRYRHSDWILLYSTDEHGLSLRTMFERSSCMGASYFIVRDSAGKIFGAFCSCELANRGFKYIGDEECFVFAFEGALRVFKSVQKNHFYIFGNADSVRIGGNVESIGCHAISVTDDFLKGTSAVCPTFDSPVLASSSEFEVSSAEVWAFYTSRSEAHKEFMSQFEKDKAKFEELQSESSASKSCEDR